MTEARIPFAAPASGAFAIQYPSGRWGFVGKVPAALAYEGDADLIAVALQAGPGIAARIAAREGRAFASLSWATEAEALAAKGKLDGASLRPQAHGLDDIYFPA